RSADAVDPYRDEERGIRLANRHGGRRGGIGQLPRADEREVLALDRLLRAALEAFGVRMLRGPRIDVAVVVDAGELHRGISLQAGLDRRAQRALSFTPLERDGAPRCEESER